MPGRTWRDLRSRDSTRPGAANDRVGQQGDAITRAATHSPRLGNLLEQRQELENRLRSLTSGGRENLDPRDAARFQVPTFAERRAQQREWEERREVLQQRAAELRRRARGQEEPEGQAQSRDDTDLRERFVNDASVERWLSQHDARRRSLRDQARDRLSPLNDVARAGRRFQDSLSNTSSKLRDLDRKLQEQGLGEEREAIRRLGADKLKKATSQVERVTRMAEAPQRAVQKIDQFWQRRQQDIGGPLDRFGSYAEQSKNRLSTDTGGSGDLFERMQRNRMRALQRRQERRREEERDEARRERARRARRESD